MTKAITAVAHKRALLFCRLLRVSQECVDRGQVSLLNEKAAQRGFSIVPATNTPVSA